MSVVRQGELFPRAESGGRRRSCPSCRGTDFTLTRQTFKDGTIHLRRECGRCGAFAGFEPQRGGETPGATLGAAAGGEGR